MKKIRRAAVIGGCGAVLAYFAAATSDIGGSGNFFSHTVKKGETVSLIAIDKLGMYTPELGEQILKDNPAIKDLNFIYPGQIIRLRIQGQPQSSDSGAKSFAVPAQQGVVTYVEGQARLTRKNAAKPSALLSNTVVYPGDVIETMEIGRVEIIINRETVIRMRQRSKLTIEAIREPAADKSATHVGFSLGALWTKMRKFKDAAARFELELPTAIAGVHGTVYESSIAKDSSSEVKVFEGEVAVSRNSKQLQDNEGLSEVSGPQEVSGPHEVSLEQWVRIVRDMQRIVIDKKGNPQPVEGFSADPDDAWEAWNKQRDRRIADMFGERSQ